MTSTNGYPYSSPVKFGTFSRKRPQRGDFITVNHGNQQGFLTGKSEMDAYEAKSKRYDQAKTHSTKAAEQKASAMGTKNEAKKTQQHSDAVDAFIARSKSLDDLKRELFSRIKD